MCGAFKKFGEFRHCETRIIATLICWGSLFAVISLGLTLWAQKEFALDLVSPPLLYTFMGTWILLVVIVFIPYLRPFRKNLRARRILRILSFSLLATFIVICCVLIYQSLKAQQAITEIAAGTRMEDIFTLETKDYKFTVGAGAIGLIAAFLYGVAKIIEVIKPPERIPNRPEDRALPPDVHESQLIRTDSRGIERYILTDLPVYNGITR